MMFAVLLWVPVAVLLWRTIVSKQHWALRFGAATAATLTLVGSLTIPPGPYPIAGSRGWLGIGLCAAAPAYLFLWSRRYRGRKNSRTGSLIASIVGFVPILAAIVFTIVYAE
jgi:hypothetical protein